MNGLNKSILLAFVVLTACFSACSKSPDPAAINFVTIPAGSFEMGCAIEANCIWTEKPLHKVTINAFKLAATETTWAQYQPCVDAGVCAAPPEDGGWGRANRPVIFVNQGDINTFINWLNTTQKQNYRLPSEAEWEYAARAGSSSAYSWGNTPNCEQAHFLNDKTTACTLEAKLGTLAVATFPPNAFGLYDMHGNVREWTQDCWNNGYKNAPADGSAWMTGKCYKAILRGGSWALDASHMRAAYRHRGLVLARTNMDGFRLAQSSEAEQ